MKRPSAARHAAIMTTDELWRLLEENLAELARQADGRHVPPERRSRTEFSLRCVQELRRRGTQTTVIPPSEGCASRNAILGWDG